MDPLSIVASATALLMTCGKATHLLHNFISSAKEVHSTITTLHSDIASLSELLEDLRVLFARREIGDVVDAGMDNFGGRVWRRAGGILESVKTTLLAVELLVGKIEWKIEGKGKGAREKRLGFARRGWMQLKVEFRSGDFELRHRQLQTQRSTLQIFLASITLCLQIHAESEQTTATENILESIAALKQDVKDLDLVETRKRLDDAIAERLRYHMHSDSVDDTTKISNPFDDQAENAPQSELDISSVEQIEKETKDMVEQLEDALESAKDTIQSAQASIASRQEGSVRSNTSVAVSEQGSFFNLATRRRVGEWVAGNIIEEESSSDSDRFEDDQVLDLESIISKRLQEKGDGHFDLKQFAEAEDAFRLSLRHYEKATTMTESHRAELRLKLALARAKQEKWKEIEELLSPLLESSIEETKSPNVLIAWHLLAEYNLGNGLLKEAETICRQVTTRRRTVLRKRDPAQEESMQLLVRISQEKSVKLMESADELLGFGIDVDSPSFDGNEELRRAAGLDRNVHLLEMLLLLPDVDIDSPCKDGLSAVAYAYARVNKIGASYSFLVGRGANTSLVDDDTLSVWRGYFERPLNSAEEDEMIVEEAFRIADESYRERLDRRYQLDYCTALCLQTSSRLQKISGLPPTDDVQVSEFNDRYSALLFIISDVVWDLFHNFNHTVTALNKIKDSIGSDRISRISQHLGEIGAIEGTMRLLQRLVHITKPILTYWRPAGFDMNPNTIHDVDATRLRKIFEHGAMFEVEWHIISLKCLNEEIQHLTYLYEQASKIWAQKRIGLLVNLYDSDEKRMESLRYTVVVEVLKIYAHFRATIEPLQARKVELDDLLGNESSKSDGTA